MNKEIKITPESFLPKRKTKKTYKKELLESLNPVDKPISTDKPISIDKPISTDKPLSTDTPIHVTETLIKPEITEIKDGKTPTYGCLKNGTKPTFRQTKNKTVKQYSAFGKKEDIVRVLIKDKDTHAKITKDKKKLDKHSMSDIRTYLKTRRLYKIGSTAPDEVLREIYKNAYLTGNVENNNTETLVHNFLNEV
jgi:hypothetical protein